MWYKKYALVLQALGRWPEIKQGPENTDEPLKIWLDEIWKPFAFFGHLWRGSMHHVRLGNEFSLYLGHKPSTLQRKCVISLSLFGMTCNRAGHQSEESGLPVQDHSWALELRPYHTIVARWSTLGTSLLGPLAVIWIWWALNRPEYVLALATFGGDIQRSS